MAPLAVLIVLLATAPQPPAVAAAADHSLIAVSRSGLIHLDSSGALLAWRPEAFQWWQDWHVATNPRNGTVCWVHAQEDQKVDAEVRCAPLASLNQTWDLPQPRSLRLNLMNALAFDWVGENWYLTVARRNYVCSYLFDRCVKLGQSDGNVRYYAAYDIPNRLLFRIATEGFGAYRLESARLDGSGLHVLPTQLTSPSGLAVDPVRRHVFLVDEIDGRQTGVFRCDYDGTNKQLVLALLDGTRSLYQHSIAALNDYVAIVWEQQKTLSAVSASDGQKTDLVTGAVKGETIPALAQIDKLLAVQIASPEAQPVVEDRCGDGDVRCQELCIPTVVNDTAQASCVCPQGRQLVDLTCQKEYPAFAVVVGADALQAVDLQTEEVSTILSNLTDGTKVDFFWAGGEEFLLFWVDAGSLFRGRWSPGGVVSDVQRLVEASNSAKVLEVAVNWVQRSLLWIEEDPPRSRYDDGSLSVKSSSFDGSAVRTVVSDSWHEPRGLVITDSGKLFSYAERRYSWGELKFQTRNVKTGANSYGGFAYQGGKLLRKLPEQVVVDISLSGQRWADRIFWVDSDAQSIEYLHKTVLAAYRLTRLLTHPSLAHVGGLDVLDSRVFWTDRSTGQLWTADSETGGGERALPVVTGGRALRLLHPWRQPPARPPSCAERPDSPCSHYCLDVLVDWQPAVQCACPDGLQLGDDQKTCEQAAPGAAE